MKKIFVSIILTISMIISAIFPAFAAEPSSNEINESVTITYLDDGSYIVKTIVSKSVGSRSSTFTKTGNIVASYYSGDDELLWQYTLYGEFLVNSGVSAVCTSATYTQNIYASSWSFSNGQATASGNTAYGVGTFKDKVLFVTIKTVDVDLNIVCDIYGNLS